MATGKSWFDSLQNHEMILCYKGSISALELIHPFTQRVPVVLSTKEKRLGREADHSPLSRAEVKKEWGHSSTCLHSVDSNKVTVTCIFGVFNSIRQMLSFI
jgi:hypothetical protein